VERIKQEILRENLTEGQLEDIINRFLERHSYCPEHLYTCAACGLRVYEEEYTKVSLTDERVQLKFKYPKQEANMLKRKLASPNHCVTIYTDEHTQKEVNAWEVVSYYRSLDDDMYYLHREVVDVDEANHQEECFLCQGCLPNKKDKKTGKIAIPEDSIAAGVDLGYHARVGLIELNLHEQAVIALNRLYLSVYKVTSNTTGRVRVNVNHKTKIHAVMYGHDAPGMIAKNQQELLDPNTIAEDVIIQFMDTSLAQVDKLYEVVNGTSAITARWWQIVSWLRVLRVVSPAYFFLSELGNVKETTIRKNVSQANQMILEDAEIVTDPDALQLENAIGSDITDVEREVPEGQERTIQQAENTEPHNPSNEGDGTPPMAVSFVLNDPLSQGSSKRSKSRTNCLRTVGKFVGLGEDQEDRADNEDYKDDQGGNSSDSEDESDRLRQICLASLREACPMNEFAFGSCGYILFGSLLQ